MSVLPEKELTTGTLITEANEEFRNLLLKWETRSLTGEIKTDIVILRIAKALYRAHMAFSMDMGEVIEEMKDLEKGERDDT